MAAAAMAAAAAPLEDDDELLDMQRELVEKGAYEEEDAILDEMMMDEMDREMDREGGDDD